MCECIKRKDKVMGNEKNVEPQRRWLPLTKIRSRSHSGKGHPLGLKAKYVTRGFASVSNAAEHVKYISQKAMAHSQVLVARIRAKLSDERGQGTTEYAILVGVLVVIAIIAITVFRPKLEELWNAISDGINSL